MKSETNKKSVNNANTAVSNNVAEEKIKFPLYVFPDTMEKVDMLYEIDNCRSKTEFMEKAIRFYCGYLLNKESAATEFIAPQLAVISRSFHVRFSSLQWRSALSHICLRQLTRSMTKP